MENKKNKGFFDNPNLVWKNYEPKTKRDKLYPYVLIASIVILIILLSISDLK